MTPPPSTPKKSRRIQPKIIGHTASTVRAIGSTARASLRELVPAHPRPSVRPPAGAPGMRGFPRARNNAPGGPGAGDPHAGVAVSVTRALREQAETAAKTAPRPELLPATGKPRRARKPGPARPSVRGRPTVPDGAEDQPLTHAPGAGRPGEPPLRTGLARLQPEKTPAPHRGRRRSDAPGARPGGVEPCTRPRPSRVLAELHAALADEAAAAE